jgi:hypothetical protein
LERGKSSFAARQALNEPEHTTMNTPIFRVLTIAGLATLLSSCHPASKMVFCPGFSSVLDAVVASEFNPGATQDPSNVLFTVKITSVNGVCDFDKKGETADSTADVTFIATRAQAGTDASYKVPYFVAVTQADRVVTKQVRSLIVSFPAGQTSVSIDESIADIHLKTDRDKKPYDYQILVGLQLTKEQLDYNRKVGIYAQ